MGLIDDLKTVATTLGEMRAISNTVGVMQENFKSLETFFKQFTVIENRFSGIQTQLGLTTEKAGALQQHLDEVAKSFDIGGEAAAALQASLKGVIGPFATIADLSSQPIGKSLMQVSKAMAVNLKMSSAEINKYIELYGEAGAGLDEQFAKQVAMSQVIENTIPGIELTKDLIHDMANLSAETELHYGRYPGQLELAVIKTKQLGINMAQLASTGENLLNIESSIGQELEYQLLSGRRLVDNDGDSLTNKYRIATIQGKANDQAMIMSDILEKEGDTLRTNMFARQQMAKLLGMEEGTLAKMLKKQEILKKLPGGEALMKLTGQELKAGLVAAGAAATDIATIMANEDTRETKDIMSMMLDKMTTDAINVTMKGKDYAGAATGVRGVATGTMTSFTDAQLSALQTELGKGVLGVASGAQIVKDFGTVLGNIAKNGFNMLVSGKAITKANPLPTFAAAAAAGEMEDFVSFPSTNRLLTAGKDSFRINDDDLIVGGTGLFNKGATTPNGTGNMAQFAQAVVTAIDRQTKELKADPLFGRGLTNSYYGTPS